MDEYSQDGHWFLKNLFLISEITLDMVNFQFKDKVKINRCFKLYKEKIV